MKDKNVQINILWPFL